MNIIALMYMFLVNEERLRVYHVNRGICEKEQYDRQKGEDGNFLLTTAQ